MGKKEEIQVIIENQPTEEEAVKMGYQSQAHHLEVRMAFLDLLDAMRRGTGILNSNMLLEYIFLISSMFEEIHKETHSKAEIFQVLVAGIGTSMGGDVNFREVKEEPQETITLTPKDDDETLH